ncbi:hypothetical protein NEISICOT_01079 [Neisseria sicca ATCC 29256]|uniref:Uncharacterized protein n=1 Tax=Neisseria sicca ATCC 29256 TaxID=547045 RepID=C6M3D1_NEISI|nr:hypothetical protein NEISICOT_01079 [Neisseria sicca ATCC 29256]
MKYNDARHGGSGISDGLCAATAVLSLFRRSERVNYRIWPLLFFRYFTILFQTAPSCF